MKKQAQKQAPTKSTTDKTPTPEPIGAEEKGPDIILKPDPLILQLQMMGGDIWVDLRHGLLAARRIPGEDPAERKAKGDRLKKIAPKQASGTWQGGERERVFQGVRNGDLKNLYNWLYLYGPRGLWLALSEPEILERLEGQWIDGHILGDEEAQSEVEAVLRAVITQKLGNDKKFSHESQRQKKHNESTPSKRHERAREYYDRAWREYIRRTKNIVDLKILRGAADMIILEEFSRKTPAKREGKSLFEKQVERDIAERSVGKIPR